MTINLITTSPDYLAALEAVVFYLRPNAGYLRISGEDRVDFLNRQTTNDVRLLESDRAVTTVLTSPTVRILDVLTLVDEGDVIGAITLDGRQGVTARHLQGKIFFMDKVAVEDASAEVVQIDLDGPDAGSVLAKLGMSSVLGREAVISTDFVGSTIHLLGRRGLAGHVYRLLVPQAIAAELVSTLTGVGAVALSAESYEILRVEAGLPAAAELTEDYNHLEANLAEAVSESKGCYTGQEIIARQITYDKVTKQLVGLRLEMMVKLGSTVEAEGKKEGTVTSVVHSPRFGLIALAYLKRPYISPGTSVSVIDGDEQNGAHVVALPFQNPQSQI